MTPKKSQLSTKSGENRFSSRIWIRRTEDDTFIPLQSKYRLKASFCVVMTLEYPTSIEEKTMKLNRTRWQERERVFFTDYDGIEEDRVRRCLVEWNLHELFLWAHPLQRQNNLLLDGSIEEWHRLPPLIRKAIATTIGEALGGY